MVGLEKSMTCARCMRRKGAVAKFNGEGKCTVIWMDKGAEERKYVHRRSRSLFPNIKRSPHIHGATASTLLQATDCCSSSRAFQVLRSKSQSPFGRRTDSW